MTIPARLHFCWIGTQLSWAHVFAVLSAVEHSATPQIILHHTERLAEGAEYRALIDRPCLALSRIDPVAYLGDTGRRLGVDDRLAALYETLDAPVMRADLLRAAILYCEGGVYLDLDTITIASLQPLLGARLFLGAEHIVWPAHVRSSRSPVLRARALLLDLVRTLLRLAPHGWRAFRRIERLYFRSLNNAAMGTEPRSAFFSDYLHAMLAAPLGDGRRSALGPDLLNRLVTPGRGEQVTVLAPRTFYPLPPEISAHWFRIVRRARLDHVLSAETRVVHWYASVRTRHLVARITPDYVRANRERQLFSRLVCASLGHVLDGL